jgi:hypothetical protein
MAENRVREKREILKSVKSYIGIGLGHIRPRIFLPTLLPLCVAHLMARSAHIPPYLARGELWVVKFRDGTMKRMLLRLVEWDALAPSVPRPTSGTSGPTCETGRRRTSGWTYTAVTHSHRPAPQPENLAPTGLEVLRSWWIACSDAERPSSAARPAR